jgi:hypothetical protein
MPGGAEEEETACPGPPTRLVFEAPGRQNDPQASGHKAKEVTVTYLKCPECEIRLIDHPHIPEPKSCPRCLLRSGAIVKLIQATRVASTDVYEGEARHA